MGLECQQAYHLLQVKIKLTKYFWTLFHSVLFFFFVDNLVRSTTKTLNLNNFLVKIRMYPSNYVKLNYFARFNLFDSLRSI